MQLELDFEKRLRDMYNTLKLAKKGNWDDYKIHLKLVLLGLAAVGAIGFLIQFLSSIIAISPGG